MLLAGRTGGAGPHCSSAGAPESGVVPAEHLDVSLHLFALGSTPQLAETHALAWLGSSVGEWQAWWMSLGLYLHDV